MRTGLSLIFMLLAVPCFAQEAERILLPVITLEPAAGAFGSLWESKVAVLNTRNTPLMVRGYVYFPRGCPLPPCTPGPVPGGLTFHPVFSVLGSTPDDGSPARFLTVEDGVGDVRVNLRIQDLSRQSLTWGTDIPVVRESDFTGRALTLVDIPTQDRFRWYLRIYGSSAVANPSVQVRYYETATVVRSPIDPWGAPIRKMIGYSQNKRSS